jgi:hypothetical protein
MMRGSSRLRVSGGPHYTIEAPPLASPDGPREPDLLAVARRNILSWLEEAGEAPLVEIPRSWPVTRFLMRHAALQLEMLGEITRVVDPVTRQTTGLRLMK